MNRTSDKYRHFIYLALMMAALAVFWQVHSFEFTNYDDDVYVSKNEHIYSGFTINNLKWLFTKDIGRWHPLTGFTHMLDCELFGLNAGRHHLTNLLLHIANTLLLFAIFKRATGAIWQSAFVAGLFAIHPLHVEAVAWISGRKDILSTLFWILTIGAYFRYVEKHGFGWYALALVLFILGLEAKPMLVTLPLVLLLLDYWPLNRLELKWAGCRRLVWEKIPFFAVAGIASIVTFFLFKSAGNVQSMEALPLIFRVNNAVVSYALYIEKMIWPSGLAANYPYSAHMIPSWQILVAAVLLLVVTIQVIRLGRKYKYLPVGWFMFLGTLVPVIGLIQINEQAMADRYTYLSLTGLFIIVAWGAGDIFAGWKYRKITLSLSSVAIILALSAAAWVQTGYWHDSQTLFGHAIKVTKGNYLAYNNLGGAYNEKGKLEKAMEAYKQSIRINPNVAKSHYNLGVAYNKLGRTAEAIACYSQAIKATMNTENKELACYNLGVAYEDSGRFQEAIEAYRNAVRIKPDYAEAYYNLGVACGRISRYQEAIDAYKQVIKIKPDYAEAHNNLGLIYDNLGYPQEAVEYYKQAVRIKPDYADPYYNLGVAGGKLGRYEEAIEAYQHAIKLKPDLAEAHNNLGNIYNELGRYQEAIDAYQYTIKLKPDFAEAYNNLGNAYGKLGHYTQAIESYKQAIKIKPDDVRVHFNLGVTYLSAGDKDAAVEQYKILQTLDPKLAAQFSKIIK